MQTAKEVTALNSGVVSIIGLRFFLRVCSVIRKSNVRFHTMQILQRIFTEKTVISEYFFNNNV
jgi:hypothetical protein